MCKRIGVLAAVIMWFLPLRASAAYSGDEGFGIGVMLGEPTGLSCKYWLGGPAAVDGGLTWSFRQDFIIAHSDYLYHFFDVIPIQSQKLAPYLGAGGRVVIAKEHVGLGVRVPFGIDFIFENAPLDFFFEIVPVVDLIPEPEPLLNASIGARFFF
jgi:hypothetical protein